MLAERSGAIHRPHLVSRSGGRALESRDGRTGESKDPFTEHPLELSLWIEECRDIERLVRRWLASGSPQGLAGTLGGELSKGATLADMLAPEVATGALAAETVAKGTLVEGGFPVGIDSTRPRGR